MKSETEVVRSAERYSKTDNRRKEDMDIKLTMFSLNKNREEQKERTERLQELHS
jgi:hypothetical protein